MQCLYLAQTIVQKMAFVILEIAIAIPDFRARIVPERYSATIIVPMEEVFADVASVNVLHNIVVSSVRT